MSSNPRGDIFARIVGMLVFLIGVGLLLLVFYRAFDLFGATPAQALGLTFTGDPKKDPTVAIIGSQFGWLLFRLGFLFIMAIAGSLISQKGINLYFSALAGAPVNVIHNAPASPPAG
jgi:hypothetical protein